MSRPRYVSVSLRRASAALAVPLALALAARSERPVDRSPAAAVFAARTAAVPVTARASAPSTTGLQLDVRYKRAGSNPPSWDPEVGPDNEPQHLKRVVEYAASVWERIFCDIPAETITIRYRWQDIPDTQWASTRIDSTGIYNPLIKFDTQVVGPLGGIVEINWYADGDPEENSEYAMRRLIYRGSSGNPAWYGGTATVPGWLEIQHFGRAQASPGVPAPTGPDLLTVALHEIGHAIAMQDTSHGPYWVRSAVSAHKICGTLSVEDAGCDDAHIRPPALMQCAAGTGVRYLPSVTDVLAVAAAGGWDEVNLPRKDMVPSCDGSYGPGLYWHAANHWFGNRVPDSFTDAFVREGGVVSCDLTAAAVARNLRIQNGVTFETNGHDLTVGERVEVRDDGTLVELHENTVAAMRELEITAAMVRAWSLSRVDCHLTIDVDGETGVLQLGGVSGMHSRVQMGPAGKLTLTGGGSVQMGHTDVQADEISLDDHRPDDDPGRTTRIIGFGRFFDVSRIVNAGRIEAQNSTLYFAPRTPDSAFDLDGEPDADTGLEPGELVAYDGSIELEGGVIEVFDGAMTVAQSLTFRDVPWTLGPDGTLDLVPYGAGGGGIDAWVHAQETTLSGTVDAHTGVTGFLGAGRITVDPECRIGVSGRLTLAGDCEYQGHALGGHVSGGGTLVQAGDVEVTGDTVIDVEYYDWDAASWSSYDGSTQETLIRVLTQLRIARGILGDYSGTVTLEPAAELVFDRDWALGSGGEAVLQGFVSPEYGPVIRCDSFTNRGTVRVEAFAGMTGFALIVGRDAVLPPAGLEVDCCDVVNHGDITPAANTALVILGDVENHGTLGGDGAYTWIIGSLENHGTLRGLVTVLPWTCE